MKTYRDSEEYRSEARHDGGGPSEGLTSIATNRKGQTIKEAVALDNQGKNAMPIRSSIHDHSFGGGTDFDEIDVLNRDLAETRGEEHPGPMHHHVRDEVGLVGRHRRAAPGFGENHPAHRGFIVAGIVK
jgi:hypothetical protein